MSSSLTPSKRSHDQDVESNGKKFQKSTGSESEKQSPKSSSGSAVFRVLCPASKVDNITGKDDSFISQICQETGIKVGVEDHHHGCDERVIFIMGAEKDAETDDKEQKNGEESSSVDKEKNNGEKQADAVRDKKASSDENFDAEKGVSAARKALLLVFEKLSEGNQELGNENEENLESNNVTLRLLVLSSQVGCLLGKGGSVIKQMSNESGAVIRVLPRDKLPSCATPSDEVVQVTGVHVAVKKAIKLISEQIIGNASTDRDPTRASPQSLGRHTSKSEAHTHASHRFSSQGAPFRAGPRNDPHSGMPFFPNFREGFGPKLNFSPDVLTYRFLCPADRVGGLIGKGGAVIRSLQHETGCDIKVIEEVPEGEDRIVVISGQVHPEERVSAIQDAVIRVLPRIFKMESESKEKALTVKVLVPSNQIGCLLGKGGAVIAEMRKVTGAHIRILGKDQIPKSATDNEEVVQVGGELEMVQEAVWQVTTRLRHHFFRENFPTLNLPLDPSFQYPSHPPPFIGRREMSPPGAFHGPSFHHFDSIRGPPHGGFHPLDDRPPFMHDIHRPGIPHMAERPWRPQGLMEGDPLGSFDFVGGAPRRMGGFGGGQQTFITNTKVEVVVPSSLVPSIYGEDGGCLKQIRQISDAKITITDPKPGGTETTIIISGTPEQTHAAQSLIQAFVISESEAS